MTKKKRPKYIPKEKSKKDDKINVITSGKNKGKAPAKSVQPAKKTVKKETISARPFSGGMMIKTSSPPKSGGHTGLYFQKYVDTWEIKENTIDLNKNEWINKVLQFASPSQNSPYLNELRKRNSKLIESAGGKVVSIRSTSRTLLGLGYDHPIENGFLFHHTLGVPFIRGTSLKGVIKSFSKVWKGEDLSVKNSADSFICTDAIPDSVKLEGDILTPHYSNYYSEGEKVVEGSEEQIENMNCWPADWENPVPVPFLSLAKGITFQLGIIPRTEEADLDKIVEILGEALQVVGIGAKTSSGYGRFSVV